MKRKVLGNTTTNFLCLALTACMLSGCGGEKTESTAEASVEEEVQYENDAAAESSSEIPEEAPEESFRVFEFSSPEEQGYGFQEGDNYFTFDADGNSSGSFDLTQISEYKDRDVSSFGCIGIYDSIFYYKCGYFQRSEDEEKPERIFACDTRTGEKVCVLEAEEDFSISDYCYNNGRIIAGMYDYEYDAGSTNIDCKYISMEKDKDTLSFSPAEDQYNQLMNTLGYYQVSSDLGDFGVNSEIALNTYGFVIVHDDDWKYYRIYADGTVTAITGLNTDEHEVAYGYNDAYLIYRADDDAYYRYDLENHSKEKLDVTEGSEFISFYHGKYYFSQDTSTDYGIKKWDISVCDVASNQSELIFNYSDKPGYSGDYYAELEFMGDRLYFTDLEGKEKKIFSIDLTDSTKTIADTGIVLETYDRFNYGQIAYASYTVRCPWCGGEDSMWYQEYPVLDGTKVNNAEIINDRFKREIDETVKRYEESERELANTPQSEYGCDHDYPNYSSDEWYVWDISLMDGRYLCVNLLNDWLPSDDGTRISQRVFDTTTGEEISFKNLYSGTEEEFKTIMASKAKEDYEYCKANGIDCYDGVVESAEEACEKAYELMGTEVGAILFEEEGITYYPYVYGLYGGQPAHRSYKASYQEIFGRNTMTP